MAGAVVVAGVLVPGGTAQADDGPLSNAQAPGQLPKPQLPARPPAVPAAPAPPKLEAPEAAPKPAKPPKVEVPATPPSVPQVPEAPKPPTAPKPPKVEVPASPPPVVRPPRPPKPPEAPRPPKVEVPATPPPKPPVPKLPPAGQPNSAPPVSLPKVEVPHPSTVAGAVPAAAPASVATPTLPKVPAAPNVAASTTTARSGTKPPVTATKIISIGRVHTPGARDVSPADRSARVRSGHGAEREILGQQIHQGLPIAPADGLQVPSSEAAAGGTPVPSPALAPSTPAVAPARPRVRIVVRRPPAFVPVVPPSRPRAIRLAAVASPAATAASPTPAASDRIVTWAMIVSGSLGLGLAVLGRRAQLARRRRY